MSNLTSWNDHVQMISSAIEIITVSMSSFVLLLKSVSHRGETAVSNNLEASKGHTQMLQMPKWIHFSISPTTMFAKTP